MLFFLFYEYLEYKFHHKERERIKMGFISKFFKFEENGTKFSKEVIAGLTTFFAMVYIIFVNPSILSDAGMPWAGVFLATIFATIIGTLIMGLFANVPYAVAPGMGLNALFTYTVVLGMGFTWQEGLAIVLVSGILNIIITVTKVRKHIVISIPKSLQAAIGGGIGLFIAYIGLINAGFIQFGAVPGLVDFNSVTVLVAVIGLVLTIVLLILKIPGAILIGIIAATIIGIPFGVTDLSGLKNWDFFGSIGTSFKDLGTTSFAAFEGFGTMFNEWTKIPMVLLAVFAFSLSDTFDTIGTFIGTGRRTGIFTDEDIDSIENSKGMHSKMEKALFADSIATSIGAVLGTSSTTTYVESAAGINAGGKTGFVSVVIAVLFLLMILLSPIAGIVPPSATAPALIIVGVMMISAFTDIDWGSFEEVLPVFFTILFMVVTYSITNGIAIGFIVYVLVKLCTGKFKEIHPIILGSSSIFIVYFILMALKAAGKI